MQVDFVSLRAVISKICTDGKSANLERGLPAKGRPSLRPTCRPGRIVVLGTTWLEEVSVYLRHASAVGFHFSLLKIWLTSPTKKHFPTGAARGCFLGGVFPRTIYLHFFLQFLIFAKNNTMKTLLILAVLLSSCTAMYFPTSSGYKNSIYYTSTDEVAIDTESYESRIHKFDAPTYTIELNLTPYYWSWRPYYYDYWGYYNPYRYYPYRSYWDWHRPYYTYYHRPSHRSSHRPSRDVYYTRRGGSTPSYRSDNRTVYRASNSTRQATTSRKTNVRYNSARPVSRSQSQVDRTGYGRSTTSTVRRSGTDYSRTSHQQSRPSERYTPQRSNTGYSGSSHSSGGGSSTRRK